VKDFIPTSPFLFRIIKRAIAFLIGSLLLLAFVIPAPLQYPGNLAQTPNPVKAAWFFLWIQELASYSKYLVYAVILAGVYFLLLPYHPGVPEAKKAEWLPRDQRVVNIVTIVGFLFITVLTIIAMFFRGENWAFVYPF
jgi:hypothetical protein